MKNETKHLSLFDDATKRKVIKPSKTTKQKVYVDSTANHNKHNSIYTSDLTEDEKMEMMKQW